MFFKQKGSVMFRNHEKFGYVTDNRNFGYKKINDNEKYIGDKILSESGAVFFSVLSRTPQNFDELANEIYIKFTDVDFETIKTDAKEFYCILEKEGFIVSGETIEDCEKKDKEFFYKMIESKMEIPDYMSNNVNFEKTTQEFLEDYFKEKQQLTNLHIEITGRCNERCVHCYIPHNNKLFDIETNFFYGILEQCREMRLLHLTLTGGEPMLHPDFCDFLRKCKEYDFSVNVLSNLTLLDEETLNVMKENPLLGVQVSLYSMDSEIHDEITQNRGSFEKTRDSILRLIENGIPLQISCPIMKQNKNSYLGVKKWAEKYNLRVGDDFVIIASYDHNLQNLSNRLSVDEAKEIIKNNVLNDKKFFEQMEKEAKSKMNLTSNDFVCSICHSSICISEKGNVYPCAGWHDYTLGNLNDNSLEYIWNNSERIKFLRDLRRNDFPKCLSCQEKEFCTMCMVRNANEDSQGDPLVVNEYFCEIAKLNKDMFFKRKEDLKN